MISGANEPMSMAKIEERLADKSMHAKPELMIAKEEKHELEVSASPLYRKDNRLGEMGMSQIAYAAASTGTGLRMASYRVWQWRCQRCRRDFRGKRVGLGGSEREARFQWEGYAVKRHWERNG